MVQFYYHFCLIRFFGNYSVKYILRYQKQYLKFMKVKQILVTSHPLDTDKAFKKSETFFNVAGNKIEFKEYKAGKITTWERYIYDSKNRLIELVKYSGNSYKAADYKPASVKYQYDEWVEEINEKGDKKLTSFYLNGTIKSRKYFNTEGLCFKENQFKKECITKSISFTEFGDISEVRNFQTDGSPLNFTINTYNEENQLCSKKVISRTGNVKEDRVFKYNINGLLVEDIDHAIDPESAPVDVINSSEGYKRKYSYNSNKLVEIENLYLYGEPIMVYRYSYFYWDK